MASIDWQAARAALDGGHLPCSSGERQVLRIAASLADGVPVDLREAVFGLDAENAARVAAALMHACGHQGATVVTGEVS
jgi:hypothetical protein